MSQQEEPQEPPATGEDDGTRGTGDIKPPTRTGDLAPPDPNEGGESSGGDAGD